MLLPLWLFFVSCLWFASGYRFLEDEEKSNLVYFPAEYKTSGEKISLTTGIITPFEAWHSSEYNRSRIDYFGGMVKRYFYAKTEDTPGQAFEIHPVTNERVANKMVCYKTDRSEDFDFLPSLDGFEFAGRESTSKLRPNENPGYNGTAVNSVSGIGTNRSTRIKIEDLEEINGKSTEKWNRTYCEDLFGMRVDETLWLTLLEEELEDVPVRYEVKSYDNWLTKLTSHVITNYFTFETSVESEDLQVENEERCIYKKAEKGDLETLAFVDPHDDELVDAVFTQYKEQHSRKYETELEHRMRRLILRKNLEKVLATNHKKIGYTLALNKFADRTEEELRHLTALVRPPDSDDKGTIPFPYEENQLHKLAKKIPKEYDMRVDGLINPAQDQGDCGACWAFGMIGTIEGALARSNGGQAIRLSEQALIDCAWGFSANGCNGAHVNDAFYFPIKHGIPTREDYGPYVEMEGYCRLDEMPSVHTIKGFTKVTPMNESALKVAIYYHGPVALTIYAPDDMELYSGGIYYDIDCDKEKKRYNHVVPAVGYGEKFGQTYWIVKNSWGRDWGSGGYILLSAKNNNCLLPPGPYYVVV